MGDDAGVRPADLEADIGTHELPVAVALAVDPSYRFPADAEIGDVKGLLRVDLARSAAATMVISYWSSAPAAAARLPQFRAQFDVRGALLSEAVIHDVRVRRRRWRPSGVAGWLQSAAGVLGAIAIMAGAWDWLTAAPAIGLTVPAQVNLLAGMAGVAEAGVVNRGDATTRVHLVSEAPGITFDPDTVSVGPRGRSTVRLHLAAAPERERTLQVTAIATAGLVRGRAQVVRLLQVVGWQPVQATPVLLLRTESPRIARLQASVGTGESAPGGLRCLAVARLPASATFTGISPAETYQDPSRNSEHANETVSITWLTPAMRAFELTTHTLFMESREAWDTPRWEALASRTSVSCERR